MKLGSVVKITWEDAWSDPNYYTYKSISEEKPYLTHSVGILIGNDKSGMSIARERFDSDGRFRSVQHIPYKMIRKVKALK
jgi:hypothetical protein